MWEIVFMLLILKIPVAYLGAVVYWAIKSEPKPLEPALLPAVRDPEPKPPPAWRPRGTRRRRGGPHGSPSRGYERPARAAVPR